MKFFFDHFESDDFTVRDSIQTECEHTLNHTVLNFDPSNKHMYGFIEQYLKNHMNDPRLHIDDIKITDTYCGSMKVRVTARIH